MKETRQPQSWNPFTVGEQAPDVELQDQDGQTIRFSEQWAARPTIFLFIRHFGCPFCRKQLGQLNRFHDEIVKAGGQIIAVGMGNVEQTRHFHEIMHMRYPLLADAEEIAYEKFGLLDEVKTLQWRIDSFKQTMPAAASMMMKKEYGEIMYGGSNSRLGGAFIINTDGIVTYVHRDKFAAGSAPIEEILHNLHATTGK
jgi:peroxiredoxin Q/BCP